LEDKVSELEEDVVKSRIVQRILDDAKRQRRLGSLSGIGGLVGTIALSIVSPPVGIAAGLIGAAVAARALVSAEDKEKQAEEISQQIIHKNDDSQTIPD